MGGIRESWILRPSDLPFLSCFRGRDLFQGVLNHYFEPEANNSESLPVPVYLLVTGTVPAGSGLSSSAAMVVSSTLAFLAVNGILEDPNIAPTKSTLVEMAVENEKRVGTPCSSSSIFDSMLISNYTIKVSTVEGPYYVVLFPVYANIHAVLHSEWIKPRPSCRLQALPSTFPSSLNLTLR